MLTEKKTLLLILAIILGFVHAGIAQNTITGTVTDSTNDQSLPGVNILVKGTSRGATTDSTGYYELNAPSLQDTLIFRFIGYKRQVVPLRGRHLINIEMASQTLEGEEMVVVGFGQQKKENVVGAVTTVRPDELKRGGTDNLTNMLAGRVGGMISFQRSGEPGANNSQFFIRGLGTFGSGKQNPLILIDGVESSATDMARLQPDDIASFSVLKDASAAAVYGSRAANGVVIIKTKSGKQGETKFKVRAQTKVSTNTQNINLVDDNAKYMNMANQAALTRDPNAVLPYSQAKIAHTKVGDNPYLYPNNHWINQLIKDATVNENITASASGGGDRARFYVSGTYNVDNGILKVNGQNNFNNNIKLRNLSVRSNINLKLTSTTKAIIRVYGQFDNYNGPIGTNNANGGEHIFNLALWSNPVRFPSVYPHSARSWAQHPLFGGALASRGGSTMLQNPYAEMVKGYQTWKRSNIQPQFVLNQDLNFVLPGLRFHAMGYLRRQAYYQRSRSYNPFYYSATPNPADNSLNLSVLNGGGPNSVGTTGTEYLGYTEGSKTVNAREYFESRFNYNHTFGDRHNVSGMMVGRISNYEAGNAGSVQQTLPSRNLGISGRFTYNYDQRYYTEFDFGYNGSENFAEDHRYGFFPSIGLAYNISNEKFFEPLNDVVTNLKLRATYGVTGNDQIGSASDRFFYLSEVNLNNGTYGATFGQQFDEYRAGVSTTRYQNPRVTWEKSRQLDVGIDFSLFKAFDFTGDVFYRHRSNILQQRAYLGASLGLEDIPQSNTGKVKSGGFEFTMHYNKNFSSNWWTQLRTNFTYAHNEVTQFSEIDYPQNLAYRSRVGHSVNQQWGYIGERLFVDENEVENSPSQFGEYTGGDIKYRDINGDGQITTEDQVPVGFPTNPEIVYGFGGTIGFKNLQLSLFFNGDARTSFFINSQNISPFVINGRAQNGLLNVVANDHWSEKDRDVYSFWPRMSNTFIENNNQQSSWWMRNGAFLRLKQAEIKYSFPRRLIDQWGLTNLNVYVNGTNLMVWSPFDLWDPEMGGNGLGYPLQKVFNFGVRLNI